MGILKLTDIDTNNNRRPSFESFKIEKEDKLRINVPTLDIACEYTHVLRTEEPRWVENQWGRKVPEWSQDSFHTIVVCTGDQDVVGRNPKQGDPANCPACAKMNDEIRLIESPRRTFAMNVIQYHTVHGDYNKLRNNNLSVKIWKHGDVKKLESIIEIANQYDGEIEKADVLISADNTAYKKLTIMPAVKGAAYLSNDDLAEAMTQARAELYDNDTLSAACGNHMSKDELQSEVNALYRQYNGSSTTASTVSDTASIVTADSGLGTNVSATSDVVESVDLDPSEYTSLLD